jgi:hypothetical protein
MSSLWKSNTSRGGWIALRRRAIDTINVIQCSLKVSTIYVQILSVRDRPDWRSVYRANTLVSWLPVNERTNREKFGVFLVTYAK